LEEYINYFNHNKNYNTIWMFQFSLCSACNSLLRFLPFNLHSIVSDTLSFILISTIVFILYGYCHILTKAYGYAC
jgi:hypothetical protein